MNFAGNDNISNVFSIHPDFSSKPVPSAPRQLHPHKSDCPFCSFARELTPDCQYVGSGEDKRAILAQTNHFYCILNRWGVFSNNSSELVVSKCFFQGMEELSYEQAVEFINLLKCRWEFRSGFGECLAYLNVGVQSGGSINHLHAQVVNTLSGFSEPAKKLTSFSNIDSDILEAKNLDLVLESSPGALSYIPNLPFGPAEVRVYGDNLESAAELTLSAIRMISNKTQWAYNVVFHFRIDDDRLFAQILPRYDLGLIYPNFFNTVIVGLDAKRYKELLLK
jgi:hypothetical protein